MKTRHTLLAGLCAAVLLSGTGLLADSATKTSKRIVRLEGSWRFAVGDAPERATPGFDDSEWAKIDVPETWQHEGYRDYSGFAWYRKTFSMPTGYEKQSLVLSLGRIDDTDEVFVNGHRVGGLGQFPPRLSLCQQRTPCVHRAGGFFACRRRQRGRSPRI